MNDVDGERDSADTRLALLEWAAEEQRSQFKELRGQVRSIQRMMAGVLASVATASILLAVDVLVRGR